MNDDTIRCSTLLSAHLKECLGFFQVFCGVHHLGHIVLVEGVTKTTIEHGIIESLSSQFKCWEC
jgi:hypothetical protein